MPNLEMQGQNIIEQNGPTWKRQKMSSCSSSGNLMVANSWLVHDHTEGTPTFLKSADSLAHLSERNGKSCDVLDYLSSEEAAAEFDQCVTLLKKYGVIKTEESSSSLLGHAPHPGFVGDLQSSKGCKVCCQPEDVATTLICDACEDVFHMACCTPRVTKRHFEKDDNWYCGTCRKLKRKATLKLCAEGYTGQERKVSKAKASHCSKAPQDRGNDFFANANYNSRARLGPAHQADIRPWRGRKESNEISCTGDEKCPGMEVPQSMEDILAEEDRLKEEIERLSSRWPPAKSLPLPSAEEPENWLQCRCVLKRGLRDPDGTKLTEDEICGKWRRAPLNIQQKDNWECFCALFWDPRHADCAFPQELPHEEILMRMGQETKISEEVICIDDTPMVT